MHRRRVVLYLIFQADIIESMWRRLRKTVEKKELCPLCGVEVQEEDEECSLCHYQLNLSPRHQSEGLADSIQSDLFDALVSEDEEEEEEIIVESSDVISLDEPDIVVEAEIGEDDYIPLPSNATPSFVSQRMTPTGVTSTDTKLEPEEVQDLDLDYSLVDEKQSQVKVESKGEVEDIEESTTPEPIVPEPAATKPVKETLDIEIPDYKYSDSVVDKVLEKYKLEDKEELIEAARLHDDDENRYLNRKELESAAVSIKTTVEDSSASDESEKTIWPWAQSDSWNAKQLRQYLMEAMQAAKDGQTDLANDKLNQLGPHLGGEIGLIFHIGALLKKLERDENLQLLLEKAGKSYPENEEVTKSIERLKQV